MRNRQRVAFLDTNVLHFLNLYFEKVHPDCRYPTIDVIEQDDTDGEGRRVEERSFERTIEYIASKKVRGEEGLWRSVGKGLKAVKFLRDGRSGIPYQVEYARVSELELMEGRVRGVVVQQFAGEGAPPRMWNERVEESELEERVRPEDRTRIWQGIEALRGALGDMGIRVADTRSGPARDVMDLAWGVMRVVHLSVCDAIVYASALRASADCLVTADEHLCRVVRGVRDAASGGGGTAYRAAAAEIQRMLAGEGEEEAVVPDGHRIKPIKRPRGQQK